MPASILIPSLRPGDYSVTAESAGFSRIVRTGVTLQVAQVARIDLTLQPGAVSETVEVVGATSLLDTETSSRGLVIDQKKIVELPLNGRDYNQLALLSPGVLPGTPRLASVNFKGVLNVNGNRTFNNVFLLDGVDNISYSNSFRGENVQLVQPSIEALQEFKIQTNAYSAEYGRSSGAVVNATIKSGSNSLRGSVYEFLRNDKLDASNFFSNALGTPKPKRERNQFGAAVGGPARQEPDVLVRRTTRGCAIRRVSRASAWCRRPRKRRRLFSSVVVDPFAAGRPAFSQNAQGQWVIPAQPLGPGRRRHRRAHSGRERDRGRPADLCVDAHHRHAAGPVRRPHRPPVHVEPDDLRPLQLRGHPDVPPGAAAGPGGGLLQRRLWIERQSIAGARARRDVDDLPDARRGHPLRGVARRLLHVSAELRHRWRGGSRAEERAERSRRSWAACRRSTSRASTPSAGIRRRRSSRRPAPGTRARRSA